MSRVYTQGLGSVSRVYVLGGQGVYVPDLPGDGHGVSVDHVEVFLPKQQQALASVEALDPRGPVHVLDLEVFKHIGVSMLRTHYS